MKGIYIDTNDNEKLMQFSIEPHPVTKDADEWVGTVADDIATSISFIFIENAITNLHISENIITNSVALSNRLSEMIEKYNNQLKSDFEAEDDVSEKVEEIVTPYNPDDIKIRSDEHPISNIFKKINKADIDLYPDFQRQLVWTDTQKSRLIESILLGIPLPVFYFAQDKENVWQVIDGLQRLSTIRDFLKNEFCLKNLEHLQKYEKKYFGISDDINDRVSKKKDFKENSTLERSLQRRIEDAKLSMNIIEPSSPPRVKYDIFKRINQGGKQLNQQEIRNSLANKNTRKLLLELSKSDLFSKTVGEINDVRMGAQEIVLRFIGFYLNLKKGYRNLEYRGDINEFLDRVNDEVNKFSPQLDIEIRNAFNKAMENANHLFGEFSFRKYTVEQIRENKKQLLNKSLFVTWSVVLTEYNLEILKSKFQFKEFASILAEELSQNENYFNGISYKSSDRLILEKSFEFAKALINRKLL